MKWLPIEDLDIIRCKMFVVKAFGITLSSTGQTYTSDPYCVWKEGDKFIRWPHVYSPTHFAYLPSDEELE